MIPIPEIFSESDTIYHYTKASTAVEHILFKRQLRLSPRARSNDPIEKVGFILGRSFYGTDGKIHETLIKKYEKDANSIVQQIDNKVKYAKQICFCLNHYSSEIEMGNPIRKDDYGFLKPRMWDQYGDKYKGVCLAFSKQKILDNKGIDIHSEIEYVDYYNLEQNIDTIDLNSLDRIGFDVYNKNVQERVNGTFFKKHKDYKNENEFRILTYSKNNYEFLDIKDALTGIIIPFSLINNEFIVEKLRNYSNEFNVELLYLDWDKNGISILSEKYFQKNYNCQ